MMREFGLILIGVGIGGAFGLLAALRICGWAQRGWR